MTAPVITVAELHDKATHGHDFFLLDVRTMPEFVAGRLEFTDALVPYDALAENLEILPSDKCTPIYCFCRSGRRSDIATLFLRGLGYEQALNVRGGIIAWVDAGYKIDSGVIEGVGE